MKLALLNIAVALFLGYGAAEELWVRGVRGGETQPLVVGIVGALVSLLLLVSGVARWRRRARARQLQIAAAVLLVAFHAYAALPPHRNVGILVLAVAVAYALVLLAASLDGGGRARRAARAAG
jgi:uncharacterized membrane protein YhaH (DUF805 family)